MKPVYKHVLITTAVLALGGAAAFALFAWSGAYNFAADVPHTAAVGSLLETMRERSIETRAQGVQMPDLADPKRIAQGSGNYDAMCVGCHLAPGMAESELSKGLYPAPPNLSKEKIEPNRAFWVIKHGIKASGMPAWGKSMSDEYVWNMAAFLQALPGLDEGKYKTMVASSSGHHHDHGAAHDEDADDHKEATDKAGAGHAHDVPEPASGAAKSARSGGEAHTHADGAQHIHTKRGAAK